MKQSKNSPISNESQKLLLRIARASLWNQKDKIKQLIEQADEETKRTLNQKRGAFVTLTKKSNELRGCIGTIEPVHSTFDIVQKMTRSSAYHDPRFPSVQDSEKDGLFIEISLLEKPKILSSLDDILIGRDGLIVEKGFHRGLLLPQVASERNWNKEEFFRHTLVKANLNPENESFSSVKTLFFSAFHFGEKDFPIL